MFNYTEKYYQFFCHFDSVSKVRQFQNPRYREHDLASNYHSTSSRVYEVKFVSKNRKDVDCTLKTLKKKFVSTMYVCIKSTVE